MNKTKVLGILIASAIQALPALASTQPLPTSFSGASTGFVQFGGSSSFQNLICFEAGCGGGFQANIYGPGSSGPSGPVVSTTVWCVDYQLDVTYGSAYSANITTLSSITSPTDSNVRYGDLNSVSNTDGWVNSLSGAPSAVANNAAYRYTLAAALVSEYVDNSTPTPIANPTNLDGNSSVNKAIQEAIWYITYNSEYQPGTTWPPPGDSIGTSTCGNGQSAGAANSTGDANYACWVQYAEANAGTVNTSAWAVISGPSTNGVLDPPSELFPGNPNYPAYQTFLVQVSPGGNLTHENPLPEPTYFLLTLGLGGLIVLVRRRRIRQQA